MNPLQITLVLIVFVGVGKWYTHAQMRYWSEQAANPKKKNPLKFLI